MIPTISTIKEIPSSGVDPAFQTHLFSIENVFAYFRDDLVVNPGRLEDI
jgi:hypothetical protein